jgi:flagellar hook-associated protein 1 FlgK
MTIAMESALSGLRAAQQQLDIVSNNVANASTEGFTRKTLPTETLIIAGEGHGVTMAAVQRRVDNDLIKDLETQTSVNQGATVTQTYLDQIQQFNGASDSNSSVTALLSNLSHQFTSLSSAPEDSLALQKTLTSSMQVASKLNAFSSLLTRMRNQAEQQISADIGIVNTQLRIIASLNARIEGLSAGGQSVADLEDQRDIAIQTVSQYVQVSTFKTNNNTIVVMTKQGQKLADGAASLLNFTPSNIVPGSFYPGGGINGITLGTDDLTNIGLGGEIGALVTMRDSTLPTYNAQLDELAQKTAERMNQQGLKLFTDLSGNVPASVPSPAIPSYVGFAGIMKVNALVQADPTLIRSGTNGNVVLPGSNEVIRKISLYAFGVNAYQQAQGTTDLTTAATIFGSTGMQPVNTRTGTANISAFAPDIVTGSGGAIAPGSQFTIDIGTGPQLITISPGDTAVNLVTNINTALGGPVASINGIGQLVLNANNTITLADVSIGAAGMTALGFNFGAYPAQNPSFTVRVGTQSPITINITAADTPATLLASLGAITGLTASINVSGQLVLVPTEGGDLTLTEGPGTPLLAMGVSVSSVALGPFRQDFLGPDGTLSTGLLANATLESFARSIVTGQTEDAQTAQNTAAQAQTYLQTLDKRNKDTSGVNIDQELTEMIRIQTNYTAAAKMLAAAERLLDALMEVVQ